MIYDEHDPTPVRCLDDCARCHHTCDYMQDSECIVEDYKFEALNIEPSVSEIEPGSYLACPFYISVDELEKLFWEYHPYERLELDADVKTDAICRKVGEACSAIDRMIATVENQLKQH